VMDVAHVDPSIVANHSVVEMLAFQLPRHVVRP
jgi:hypothetical protein